MTRYWGILTVPGFPHERAKGTCTHDSESQAYLLNLSSSDNLGWLDPHPPPQLRCWLYRSLLFLFERTHNYPVYNQEHLPWRLSCLGKCIVRSTLTNTSNLKRFEQIELQAKLLNYFLGSNKSNINQSSLVTGPLLFLFERTYNNQGLVPWRLRCVGESKVCSAS